MFTQKPTVDSIGKALADAGKLVIDKDTEAPANGQDELMENGSWLATVTDCT